VALGPKPRTYGISINKKVKRLAMKSALSSKVAADEMLVLDSINLDAIKTKTMAKMFADINAGKKVLVGVYEYNTNKLTGVELVDAAAVINSELEVSAEEYVHAFILGDDVKPATYDRIKK
jgi:ribosomal protein L4